MVEEPKPKGWWSTVPGILTAAAGIITAVTGLVIALNEAGIFGGQEMADSRSTPVTVSPPTEIAPTKTLDAADNDTRRTSTESEIQVPESTTNEGDQVSHGDKSVNVREMKDNATINIE